VRQCVDIIGVLLTDGGWWLSIYYRRAAGPNSVLVPVVAFVAVLIAPAGRFCS